MAVCVWDGCVCAAASGFVLGVHHRITADRSGAVLVTTVTHFTCCVMWVQWWEGKVFRLAVRENLMTGIDGGYAVYSVLQFTRSTEYYSVGKFSGT